MKRIMSFLVYVLFLPMCLYSQGGRSFTYLLETDGLLVNSGERDFHQKLCNSKYGVTYLGKVWYVRDEENQGFEVHKYRMDNPPLWEQYGGVDIYVLYVGNRVKFIDVDFSGVRERPLTSKKDWQEAVHPWGSWVTIFKDLYGKVNMRTERTDGYIDLYHTWNRPDDVKISVRQQIYLSKKKLSDGEKGWDLERYPIITIRYDVL